MTDTQILTLIIGITFPVLGVMGSIAALIYSNKRLDDFQKNIGQRMDGFEKNVNQRIDDLQRHLDDKIDNAFAHMELLLKIHEAEHHKQS